MTKLEQLIVSEAQRALDELQYAVANPGAQHHFEATAAELDLDWKTVARHEQTQRMSEIYTLVGLALVADNGMTSEAINALQAIEQECNGLVRTASWLQWPPKPSR